MLRINKASEYGVLALKYIGGRNEASSAREISEGLSLPYELTAKTLQRLKEAGFIGSSMGTKGGYVLINSLSEISFAQVIDALEGPIAIVECAQHEGNECIRNSACGLKDGMKILNEKIRNLLEETKLAQLVNMEKRA
jgi:Rrf2 family protein